jgi:hypothetical protein
MLAAAVHAAALMLAAVTVHTALMLAATALMLAAVTIHAGLTLATMTVQAALLATMAVHAAALTLAVHVGQPLAAPAIEAGGGNGVTHLKQVVGMGSPIVASTDGANLHHQPLVVFCTAISHGTQSQ